MLAYIYIYIDTVHGSYGLTNCFIKIGPKIRNFIQGGTYPNCFTKMFTVFHQLQTLVDFFDHGAAVRGVEDVERCNCVFDGSGRWRVNGRPTCGKFPQNDASTMLHQLNFSSTC